MGCIDASHPNIICRYPLETYRCTGEHGGIQMRAGCPNIWGIQTYGVCPNIWGHPFSFISKSNFSDMFKNVDISPQQHYIYTSKNPINFVEIKFSSKIHVDAIVTNTNCICPRYTGEATRHLSGPS